ncbi:hypothetical protein GGH95_003453 [Coemansia sp. RSA 1836]|nr:hypothetical protein GGH95_003453 [Coemansia sp. RSA 1836]
MQSTAGVEQQYLIADGVVAEIRTNGLIVYVPKFGLRGPVHLRDSSGQIKLAVSVLSGSARDSDSFIDGCSEFTADTKQLSIRLPMNVPVFQLGSQVLRFSMFDHAAEIVELAKSAESEKPKTDKKSSDYYSVLEKFGDMSLLETHCDVQTL